MDIKSLSRVSDSLHRIEDMALINGRDRDLFPYDRYRVIVQGDESEHKLPHFHIKDIQDGWEIRVLLNGDLWNVKRGKDLKIPISSIVKKLKKWLGLKPAGEPDYSSNIQFIIHSWYRQNPESSFNDKIEDLLNRFREGENVSVEEVYSNLN